MINTTPLAKQAASARRAARGPWLLALVLLPLSQAKAGEPGSPPLALSPTAYRVVYNVTGDHRFRVLPVRAGVVVRRYASDGGGDLDPQFITLPAPMDTLAEPSGGVGTQPLLLVQAAATASSLGVEITSQSTTSASTNLPPLSTIMPSGYGGLSLVQLGQATSGAVQGSPVLAMCGQQYTGTGSSGYACWNWQVLGSTGTNQQDVLQLSRTTTNSTGNLTVLFPAAINLATAPTSTGGAGQITVGPQPIPGGGANVLSTFTGADTNSNGTAAVAGTTQIWPGFLQSPSSNTGAQEGAIEIGQGYKPGAITANDLACIVTTNTAQYAGNCTSTSQSLVGVFISVAASGSSGVALRPPSRATVASASSTTYTAGTPVCRDPSNPSEAIDTGVPCQLGQQVGTAVGDPSAGTTHLVDLDFSSQQVGSSGNATTYATAASSLGSASAGSVACADGSGNVTTSGCGTINNAVLMFWCSGAVTTGTTIYLFPGALLTSCAATIATQMIPVSFSGTIKNLEVFYGTAPGASQTDTFKVVKCPGLMSCAATAVTCTISGTGTPSTCSDTSHSVAVSQGDGIQIEDVTAGSSGAKDARATIQIQ